jgi:hypothetical protein
MQHRLAAVVTAFLLVCAAPVIADAQAPAFGTAAAAAHAGHPRTHVAARTLDRQGRQLERRGERLQRHGARLQGRGRPVAGHRLMREGRQLERRGERMQRQGARLSHRHGGRGGRRPI